MMETTLAIIKPDAVAAQHTNKIINLIEQNGFKILAKDTLILDKKQAEKFYAIHKDRTFFNELVSFMTSGPVVVMALRKENAIADWRRLMGDTNPAKAAPGTVRKQFGIDIGRNATHGSDAPATAATEVAFFFPKIVKA